MIGMTNDEASDLLALIGPLPEQPKTPAAPTPWQIAEDDAETILDATGRFLFDSAHRGIAALVVKLVNAAAAGQATTEREVDHYVDVDGAKWWPSPADDGRCILADSASQAERDHLLGDTGTPLDRIVDRYGATPVYKP